MFIHGINWSDMFRPGTPIVEIVIRGSLMYLALFFLLRVILKRQAGTMSLSDLLLIVLIADAAQNGMADDYKSITDGVVLVAVLIFWNYLIDRLSNRIPWLGRLVHPPPVPLIRDGKILWRNMRRESLTREELFTQLREQGLEDVEEVKLAQMEGDGRVSVIERHTDGKHDVKGTRERKGV
jgi:uncharacterized membrane protein YcaP (DUF421 family)